MRSSWLRPNWLACFILLGVMMPLQTATAVTPQQSPDFELRIAKLEAERAALREDVKSAKEDIARLQDALKDVREKAQSAGDLSQTNAEQIGIGRWLVSGMVFILGAIVTQWITRFMTSRRSPAKN